MTDFDWDIRIDSKRKQPMTAQKRNLRDRETCPDHTGNTYEVRDAARSMSFGFITLSALLNKEERSKNRKVSILTF